MPKKKTDDTPEGGWLAPGVPDETGDRGPRVALHYAEDTRIVRGQRVWNWKPITPTFLARLERQQAKAEKEREAREREREKA